MPLLVSEIRNAIWSEQLRTEEEKLNKAAELANNIKDNDNPAKLRAAELLFPHILFAIYSFLVLFIGLFTSDWELFLGMLLFGWIMSNFKLKSTLMYRLDAIFCILLYIFMYVNKFHLHLPLILN